MFVAQSPTAQTVVYIASGKLLGLPAVTSEGTVNFTTPQLNQDPRITRWVYVKLPSEIAKGKSVQLVVSFAPKRRKTVEDEEEAKIFLEFNADEEEPEIKVQVLAPNFNMDPPAKEIALKLLRNREVSATFRITPSQDAESGKAEIDILAFYKGLKVGEFSKKVKIKDHSVDHLTARQANTIIFLVAIGAFVFTALQFFFGSP